MVWIMKDQRKLLLIILFLLFLCMPVFSSFNGIGLKMGNDLWTHGISYNNDDQLTYSFGAEVYLDDYTFDFDYKSFTSRDEDRRFDYITLIFSRTYRTENSEITGSLGVAFSGDFGGQKIQNLLHSFIKVPEVVLEYSYPAFAYPMGAFKLKYSFDIATVPYIYTDINMAIGNYFSAEIGLGFTLDLLQISLGYVWYSDNFDLALQDYVNKKTGLNISYLVDKGILKMKYEFNPISRLGYTTFLVNPFAQSKFGFCTYSIGKIYSFRDFIFKDSFELAFYNAFVFSRVHTGVNKDKTARIEESQIGAGYDFNYTISNSFFSVHAKPYVLYAYYNERTKETNTIQHKFGLGLEGEVSILLSKYYGLDLVGGVCYVFTKGFQYYSGLNLKLK